VALNLNTAMDALGTALAGVTGLRVYDYEASTGAVPAAMVLLPEELVYDNTKGRGTDRAVFPILVMVGKISDRSARDRLAGYCDGTGAATVSVKAALDAAAGVLVNSVTFESVTWGGVPYLAAEFSVQYTA
jgi:hypothetical protein